MTENPSACPVCASRDCQIEMRQIGDPLFRTSSRAFDLRHCVDCRTLFVDPMPMTADLAGYYPSRYWWKESPGLLNRLEAFYRRAVLMNHISFATRVCGAGLTRLLDVGCGSGAFLKEMKQRGVDAAGFEFSADAAACARDASGAEVRAGASLGEAGYTPGSFDVITLFHLLEHVPAPYTLIADVRRLLSPNGCLIVQVPNIQSWQARLFGSRWYGLDVPRHVVNYSNRSLERLLRECGFRIQRVRHFNLRDNAPALASSAAPSLDPVSRYARGVEPFWAAAVKHGLYLVLVALSFPFALMESAAGAGATVMVAAYRAEHTP
jgi:SAM-dependent methyltransferase